ncbi:disulfide bond formation protein B [Pseudooceanicola sp. 502str34]|uniref:disulfide bond formation protein B n=1 Tax=Maritimibacter alkaliphilus TaxID=404236 RepID=UPI001C98E074|nr:disulfide bond formation protein B [Maritimibacter alkaliphilus]MBY6092772.1 disulfide bond formation protein B [Maritimibacter alkaliphilus]
MNYRTTVLLAAGGSAALLLGALGFQYIAGIPPCKLCYWQRYPHAVAIVIGLAALVVGERALGALLAWFGAIAALATAGIGVFHTGVERGWWEGPTSCTSGSIADKSTGDLFDQIMNAPLIRCDEVAWSLFGLSMASWNALFSLVIAGLWIRAALMAQRPA